jgi:hypothetical protein
MASQPAESEEYLFKCPRCDVTVSRIEREWRPIRYFPCGHPDLTDEEREESAVSGQDRC